MIMKMLQSKKKVYSARALLMCYLSQDISHRLHFFANANKQMIVLILWSLDVTLMFWVLELICIQRKVCISMHNLQRIIFIPLH